MEPQADRTTAGSGECNAEEGFSATAQREPTGRGEEQTAVWGALGGVWRGHDHSGRRDGASPAGLGDGDGYHCTFWSKTYSGCCWGIRGTVSVTL